MKRLIFSLLVVAALPSAAQHNMGHPGKNSRMINDFPSITRSLGGSFQQFSGLNGRVENLPQYKPLKHYTPTIGLGWMKERNRFISDMGITAGSSMSRHRNKKSSTVRYIGFNTNAGYDLLKNEKITLYPLAGVGFQTYQAVFYKDNTGVDFDDILSSSTIQNSISPVKFRNNFWVFRVGAGIFLSSHTNKSGSIGLQAGYTGSFRRNAWKSNENQSLGNAPGDRISQFYFSLVLASKPWMRNRGK